ncbi:hypothetical protein OD91_1020 [Lutibacter sp. Hel_I_33_5]|nr:hypothetical protein OD91_1020 [Lutibacter sp. Hel_I_33_5]
MGTKTELITSNKNRQEELKSAIQKRKKRATKYLTGFILLSLIFIVFMESRVYSYFGNSINFILVVLSFTIIICLTYLIRIYLLIDKKNKEIKEINNKLYQLMRLETTSENE